MKNETETISKIVGDMLRSSPLTREHIAQKMSQICNETISPHMLDAWSSPRRRKHNIPMYRVSLLEQVCDSTLLSEWLANQQGGVALFGRDIHAAEIGKLTLSKSYADKKIHQIAESMEADYVC